MEAVAADGHEVGLHGYMHEVSWEQDAAAEEEILDRGLAIDENGFSVSAAGRLARPSIRLFRPLR